MRLHIVRIKFHWVPLTNIVSSYSLIFRDIESYSSSHREKENNEKKQQVSFDK